MNNQQKTINKDELAYSARTGNEVAYWVGFNYLEITPAVFSKLLEIFGTAKKAWEAKQTELEKLNPKLAQKIVEARKKIDCEKLLAKIQKDQIRILTFKDKQYPANLSQIEQAPFLLYIKGQFKPEDCNSIAVVGARKVTTYGRLVTETFVQSLVISGLTVISGLAKGVDSIAHSTALTVGGRTIAVLGSGVDVIYPSENKKLYYQICQNGAVISEFAPATPPRRENFPTRNRIIAGLSKGVLVTEAAQKSGSLITAGFAAEYGREVFAVPGPVYSAMSEGTANLIKDGAKLVYRASDILEELHLETPLRSFDSAQNFAGQAKNSVEGKILEILQDEPKHVDQIIQELGLPTAEIIASLTLMEVKGLVKNLGVGLYSKK